MHKPEIVSPSAAPPLTWQLILANFGVQLILAFVVGIVTLLVLMTMGTDNLAARGGAIVATLIGLWAARSLVHWPIPKATLKAQAQLPPNIRPAETGGREIVETVVFVVVLVLLLKSFAAEAFVIPTGSMAETLYGYQKIVTCPSCGDEFPVNCSREVDPSDQQPAEINGCTCRNCRRNIRLVSPRWRTPHEGVQGNEYVEIADPGPSSGDRVLVGKFLYDASLANYGTPDRLDVVVFKYPKEPQTNGVAMNYIKRLVGLPGETIAIFGGDLYVLRPGKTPLHDDSKVALVKRWESANTHQNDSVAAEKWKANQFEILRKSPRVLLSMMRIVYDNDHLDPKLIGLKQRWRPDGAVWEQLDGGKSFRHPTRADAAEGWLRYHHILRRKEQDTLITDFMGYNSVETLARNGSDWLDQESPNNGYNGNNWVGDLILECEVKVEKAEGELVLELVRSGERYRATFNLASEDGRCTLSRGEKGDEVQIESQPTQLRKGTHKLRFANVDQRLTVWVDGSLPFEDGVAYVPPAEKGPKSADLQPASVGIKKGATVTVQNIKLFRDSYYTTNSNPREADVKIEDPGDPRKWAELREPPLKTLYVQPGHFLCLGDNSPESSDGRTWGLVPERLLLGRALLVYWPPSRAGRIR